METNLNNRFQVGNSFGNTQVERESPLIYLFSIRQFVRRLIGLENFPGTPGQCLA